jgi:hypothetical protein
VQHVVDQRAERSEAEQRCEQAEQPQQLIAGAPPRLVDAFRRSEVGDA